jgi:hypothetical protein
MELRLVNANKETEDRQMSAPVYQGIADHIVAAIREKDAIVERLERENAALREALTDAASRFADAATVMRERPDYYNPDYYERTAWRCWHVLNRGGRYHDDNYDNPPPTREPTETPPARDCGQMPMPACRSEFGCGCLSACQQLGRCCAEKSGGDVLGVDLAGPGGDRSVEVIGTVREGVVTVTEVRESNHPPRCEPTPEGTLCRHCGGDIESQREGGGHE